MPSWNPTGSSGGDHEGSTNETDGLLTMAEFDIGMVLGRGKLLGRSEGREFEPTGPLSREQLQQGKQQLLESLGIRGLPADNTSDLVDDQDLAADAPTQGGSTHAGGSSSHAWVRWFLENVLTTNADSMYRMGNISESRAEG